jgi:germination protein M
MRLVTEMAVLMVALAGACGSSGAVDEGTVGGIGGGSVPAASQPVSQPGPDTTQAQTTLQVWLRREDTIWPVRRSVPQTPAVGRAAMHALLAGPTSAEQADGITTVVPAGTRLLGLSIAHGTATVDLSSEYESAGDQRSITTRLAQVVYTLTEFPTVRRVAFRLDGEPVTAFPGSGIALTRPQTRQDYAGVVPAIVVAEPALGDEVSSPVTVSGIADVFEANVSIEVLDAHGHLVGSSVTLATCGTGCIGSYSASVSYTVDARQAGTIVVHDDDAAGTGTYPHEVRIPVVLTS